MKIWISQDPDDFEHVQSVMKTRKKVKEQKGWATIPSAEMAHFPRHCGCGRTFWVPDNSDRWECFNCAPTGGGGKRTGF